MNDSACESVDLFTSLQQFILCTFTFHKWGLLPSDFMLLLTLWQAFSYIFIVAPVLVDLKPHVVLDLIIQVLCGVCHTKLDSVTWNWWDLWGFFELERTSTETKVLDQFNEYLLQVRLKFVQILLLHRNVSRFLQVVQEGFLAYLPLDVLEVTSGGFHLDQILKLSEHEIAMPVKPAPEIIRDSQILISSL